MGLLDDLQGWHSDHPAFRYLIDETQAETVIEVGSWKGASAIHMARIIKERPGMNRIFCIDTWLGGVDHVLSDKPIDRIPKRHGYPQLYFQFLHNVKKAGCQDVIIPMPMTSATGAQVLAKRSVLADLVYVDGSHTFDDCWADINAYWKLLRPGGILFGDDWGFLGVQAAALRFSDQEQIAPKVIADNFWFFKKAA